MVVGWLKLSNSREPSQLIMDQVTAKIRVSWRSAVVDPFHIDRLVV